MMSSTSRTWRSAEVEVEVLHDAHHTARLGGAAVGRDGHEVELDRQLDLPGQVGHEHERTLEHADQQRGAALVVIGDLLAELADAGLRAAPRLTTTSPSAGSSNRWRCGSMDEHPPTAGRRDVCSEASRRAVPPVAGLEPQPALRCGPRRQPPPTSVARTPPRRDVEHPVDGAPRRAGSRRRPASSHSRIGDAGQRRRAPSTQRRARRSDRRWRPARPAGPTPRPAGRPGGPARAATSRSGDVVEQRQHLVAHPVAAERRDRRSTGRAPARGRAPRTAPRSRGAAGRAAGARPSRRIPASPSSPARAAG